MRISSDLPVVFQPWTTVVPTKPKAPSADVDTFVPSTKRVATPSSPDPRTPTQKRLDAFAETYAPSYELQWNGEPMAVTVPVHFRRNYKEDGTTQAALGRELLKKTFNDNALWGKNKDLWTARIGRLAMGRGTPTDVRVMTQTLIDAGLLPTGFDKPEDAVRELMWKYAIGVDCVGYAAQAVAAGAGKSMATLGVSSVLKGDAFYPMLNPHFKKVNLLSAKPGDAIVLTDSGGSGHNVVLYARQANVTLSEDQKNALKTPKQKAFAEGVLHRFDVDASWGARGWSQNNYGGMHRVTWFYNETTKQWAELKGDSLEISTTNGPYDHLLTGVFRPE